MTAASATFGLHSRSDSAHPALPSLLIADDEPVVRAALGSALSRTFDVVGQCDDAESAIRLAAELRPALALIDVEMPGGGLYATQAIHARSPETAIVILSSDRSRLSVLRYLDAGAVAFLRKGLAPGRLGERLRDALRAHGEERGQRERDLGAERVRRAAEERFRAAFDQAGIGMAIVPLRGEQAGRLLAVNDAYAAMLGRSRSELVGRNSERWTHTEDLPDGVDDPMAALASGDADRVQFEARMVRGDGSVVFADITASAFVDEDGVRAAILQVVDVSERRRLEAGLQYRADHDPLTGAFNRRRFDEELRAAVARARRYGHQFALLALDLDGFKQVNDRLGHAAGDELVVRLSRTIRDALRESDVLARMGGDEFAVLLPEADPAQASIVAGRLLHAIRHEGAVVRGNERLAVTTSIGIAFCEGSSQTTADELLVEADAAMYEAKAAGKDRVRCHDRDAGAVGGSARDGWESRLRAALAEDRLTLLAQPIVPLNGPRSGWFELLLRLRDDRGQLIAPEAFLDHAERFGLLRSIDSWVLGQAVELLSDHEAAGSEISVSINLSPATLQEPDLVAELRRLLEERPIRAGSLIVGIGEAASIANVDRARELAAELRALGCGLTVDDFGARFTTLRSLRNVGFDYVKLDRELVTGVTRSQAERLIVRALVDVTRGLGADTIAEQVNDGETLRTLTELGVGYARGYRAGTPVAASLLLSSPAAAA